MARSLSTRSRFLMAYLVLGAAVGTGIGVFIVLLERPGPKPPPAWSSWKPPAGNNTVARTRQIATHVGSGYRLASGDPMNRIVIGAPGQARNTVRAIGIQKTLQAKSLNDFELYDQSESVMYVLCGPLKSCKLQGNASEARGTVVRREALELALYTLKYSNSIDNVVVFVPPGPQETKLSNALFFRRQDLSPELDHPLKSTLPQSKPPLPGKIDRQEQTTVDSLTRERLYRYLGLANANNFGQVVVLQPA